MRPRFPIAAFPLAAAFLLTAPLPLAAEFPGAVAGAVPGRPLPIDPLWRSETFRRSVTASFGIDSRIEPVITADEAHYLEAAAEAMASGDRPAAIAALRGSSLLDRSAAMRFNLATHLLEEGERDEAVALYRAALEQFPNFRDAHRNLAAALVQAGEHEAAVAHLVRAVELGSREGFTLGLLGYCHALEGRHRSAHDAYRMAALTQPDERQWRLGEAQALVALGRAEEAQSILAELVAETPQEWNLWLARADAFLQLGRDLDAAAQLELVSRAGELPASGLLTLGHLHLRLGLAAEALASYHAALRHEEPASLARLSEAVALLSESGRWEETAALLAVIEAVEAHREALASPPGEDTDGATLSRLHRARALLALARGERAEGKAVVARWLELEPTDGRALLLIAAAHEEDGEREEAEMRLEQAAALADYAAEAHHAWGRLLVQEGEYQKALAQLERAQVLEPNERLAEYLEAVREFVP